ncbi:MAG: lipid A deacylase LpxR family protein [Sphingobacteriales bacterium]|nr:MAG: lipid A deacylase LpxR family protein [Sphingobacteriales bacterium]
MRPKLLLSLVLVFSYVFCAAQGGFKNSVGLKSDNDSYLMFGSDRYYTNGLFLNYSRAFNQLKTKEKVEKNTLDLTIAQKMYNPFSGNVSNPRRQDRPFAAYLYAGASYNIFYKNESVLKAGLQVGVVGESAYGKEGQELFHQWFGFYEVTGWEYGIRDAFAFNMNVQYLRKLLRSSDNVLDMYADAQLNVGTTYNSAAIGFNIRAGNINQLFQSISTNSIISNNGSTPKLSKKNEFFFYLRPGLEMVLTDATIQGGFGRSHRTSPVTFGVKPYVFSQAAGINYSSNRFTFDYRVQFNSREVKSAARPHQFGSITMNYRFN